MIVDSLTLKVLSDFAMLLRDGYVINEEQQLGTHEDGKLLFITKQGEAGIVLYGFKLFGNPLYAQKELLEKETILFDTEFNRDADSVLLNVPLIYIHDVFLLSEEFISGGEIKVYRITLSLLFNDEHSSFVDDEKLNGTELAHVFFDRFKNGMRKSPGRWPTMSVQNVTTTGNIQTGRKDNKKFYGFVAEIELRFS